MGKERHDCAGSVIDQTNELFIVMVYHRAAYIKLTYSWQQMAERTSIVLYWTETVAAPFRRARANLCTIGPIWRFLHLVSSLRHVLPSYSDLSRDMELNRVTHDQEEIPRGTPSDIELVPSSSEDSVRLTVYNDDDEDDNEIRFDTPFLASSLAWQSVPSHNAADAPLPLSRAEMKRLILRTMTTTSLILMASMALLALILYLALPTFSEEEQAALRIPRSLEQLKSLLQIFGKYSQDHYYRVMLAWISVFLFIQTFSIPGAMYLAMLAGALWGTPVALPLVCIGIATGASSCYLLSKHVGGIVRVLPRWQHRIDSWKSTIQQYQNDLFSYLTILRMMPVPPHFILNLLAPHLGVPLGLFWLSTLSGVFCSSLIYTAIGEELEQISSTDDFHLFTWRNALMMTVVGLAALLPVILKGRVQAPEDDTQAASGPIYLTDNTTQHRWRMYFQHIYRKLLSMISPGLLTRLDRPSHVHRNEDHDDEEQPGDNSVIEWQHALEDREMQPASALRFTDDDIEALEDYEEDGLYRPTPSARREDILAYANKTSHFAEET